MEIVLCLLARAIGLLLCGKKRTWMGKLCGIAGLTLQIGMDVGASWSNRSTFVKRRRRLTPVRSGVIAG